MIQFGHLVDCAVVVETVSAYPGMGRLAVQAVSNKDATVIRSQGQLQGTVIAGATTLPDLTYSAIDPRPQHE